MAKLVGIIKEWPEGAEYALQNQDQGSHEYLRVYFFGSCGEKFDFEAKELAEDAYRITRYEWEAERARIATNQRATAEARDIAEAGTMTNEEQELAAIACGKRSTEDQALWDKAALAAFTGYCARVPTMVDAECSAYEAMHAADFFMQERAKRLSQWTKESREA